MVPKMKGLLLSIIDKTKTAAGSRKNKKMAENPLINLDDIIRRQNIVTDFIENYFERMELQNFLKKVYDDREYLQKFLIILFHLKI